MAQAFHNKVHTHWLFMYSEVTYDWMDVKQWDDDMFIGTSTEHTEA